MRRFTLLGLALVAVFASTAALASSAFALNLPENLPVSTTRTWVGKSIGNWTLKAEGQSPITCLKTKGEGTETSSKPPLGLFHIDFEECSTESGGIKVKCTGLGEATGVILVLGEWHLVWDRLKGGSFALTQSGLLLLNNAAHLACSIILVELLAGEALCLHLEAEVKKATHEYHCFGEVVGGVPKPTEEWCAADPCVTPITPALKESINMSASEVPVVLEGLATMTALHAGAEEAIFADQ